MWECICPNMLSISKSIPTPPKSPPPPGILFPSFFMDRVLELHTKKRSVWKIRMTLSLCSTRLYLVAVKREIDESTVHMLSSSRSPPLHAMQATRAQVLQNLPQKHVPDCVIKDDTGTQAVHIPRGFGAPASSAIWVLLSAMFPSASVPDRAAA